MPTTATSFIAERTRGDRKIFDTLDAALYEETKTLHDDLIAAVTFLHFVDGVSINEQFERLRPKFAALKSKALEWETARAARAEEFTQRAAADIAEQEAYWATFYANKEKIARAIARDVAIKEQAHRRPSTSSGSAFPEPVAHPEPAEGKPVALPELVEGNICEQCGKPMRERMGKTGKFLGCSGYPTCRNTRPIPGQPADNLVEMRRAA